MKKLLFITTSSLAANPRLVKEFEALKANYECHVISFLQADWSRSLSLQSIERNPEVTFYFIDRKEKLWDTIISKIIHKIAIFLNPLLTNNLWIAAHASHDRTFQLKKTTSRIVAKVRFGSIIAHNLGAFYPAYRALGEISKLQLDIEDYHPGEIPYFNPKYEIQNRILIMRKLLEAADYITYASPLIMRECFKLFNKIDQIKLKSTVVNNCFSEREFQYVANSSQKIKFVWFSQNIAKGRGLEIIIPILAEFSQQVELHLIGNLYEDFEKQFFAQNYNFIFYHPPRPQAQLNLMLANFDIGLALEIKSEDFNRQICLTNKIWAYLQSGLYILATATPAQKQFLENHKNVGRITSFTSSDLRQKIAFIIDNKEDIREEKVQRYENAKQFSWEVEQLRLKNLIHS